MLALNAFDHQDLVPLAEAPDQPNSPVSIYFDNQAAVPSIIRQLGLEHALAQVPEQLPLSQGTGYPEGQSPFIIVVVLAPSSTLLRRESPLCEPSQERQAKKSRPPCSPGSERSHAFQQENFGGLSPRERQVATLIASGKSNREIANEMTVGVKTVETYMTRILNKLVMNSRTQVAVWAVEKGLGPKQ